MTSGHSQSLPRCWHFWRSRRTWLVQMPNLYERRCASCRVFL